MPGTGALFPGTGATSGPSEAEELRRLATGVVGGEAGAALQLQRLCDLLRAKTAVSFACVDVFGAQRPCSCTLAASGCAEAALPLGVPRLHTPAEVAEARLVLPPHQSSATVTLVQQPHLAAAYASSGGASAACTLATGGGGPRTSVSSVLFSSARTTPTSPPAASALLAPAAPGGGPRRASAGGVLAGSSGGAAGAGVGAAGFLFATTGSSPYRHYHPALASTHSPPDRWSVPYLPDRWSCAPGDVRPDGRGSAPTAATLGLAAALYTDRNSAPTAAGGGGAATTERIGGAGGGGGSGYPPAYCSNSSEAAAAAAAAFTAVFGSAGGGGAPQPRCLYGTCLEALPLPRHIRRLAERFESELRSFWVVPLLASEPSGGGGGAAAAAAAAASGAEGPEVVGVLYLMGGDEQLFGVPRDTLDQFRRWMSHAVAEGQLRVLADLTDRMAHAPGPEAAVAAVAAHLSDFFTHRTQGMAEVLAYPTFLPREAPGSAIIMLPPAANRLATKASAAAAAAAAETTHADAAASTAAVAVPAAATPTLDGAVAVAVSRLTAGGSGDAQCGAAAASAAADHTADGGGGAASLLQSGAASTGGPSSWLCSGEPSDGMPSLEPFALRLGDTLLQSALAAGCSRGHRLQRPVAASVNATATRSAGDAALVTALDSLPAGRTENAPTAKPDGRCGSRGPGGAPSGPRPPRRRAEAYAAPEAPSAKPPQQPAAQPSAQAAVPPPPHRYLDLQLLPGKPRYVLAGAFRDAAPAAGVTTATPATAAAPLPPLPTAATPTLGLYLSFSELLRDDLIRELHCTLDALLVLLARAFYQTFGSEGMRAQLEALLRAARPVP